MGVFRRKTSKGLTKEYHYKFVQDKKTYRGVCEGCTTEKAALAYEKRIKDETKKASEQKTVKALVENFRDTLTGGTNIPLAEAMEKALAKPTKKDRGEKRAQICRSIWADFLAFLRAEYPDTVNITDVTTTHAEAYISKFIQQGRYDKTVTYAREGQGTMTYSGSAILPSSSSIKLYRDTCRMVFSLLAADAGLISNPFENIQIPTSDAEDREPFTQEELKLIFENADDFIRPVFTIGIATALREGDICTLRWSDVDFTNNCIKRRMNKTKHTVVIPILPPFAQYLQSLRNDTEYVLPEHAKMYQGNQTGISYRVKTFLEGLGITTTRVPEGRSRAVSIKDVHSLRHTFCYMCALAGIPIATVQSIVGHMTPAMTAHYTNHFTAEDKRKALQQLSGTMMLESMPTLKDKVILLLDHLTGDQLQEILDKYSR